MPGRNHVEDLRGASRLAVEATRGVTDLVEAVHRKIASGRVSSRTRWRPPFALFPAWSTKASAA